MRPTRLLEVFCVALCAAALALPARAEPAGKVLTAGGDVLVLRGSQILLGRPDPHRRRRQGPHRLHGFRSDLDTLQF